MILSGRAVNHLYFNGSCLLIAVSMDLVFDIFWAFPNDLRLLQSTSWAQWYYSDHILF